MFFDQLSEDTAQFAVIISHECFNINAEITALITIDVRAYPDTILPSIIEGNAGKNFKSF